MNKLFTGVFLFFSTLFSCQQKGEFKSLSVNDFESLIEASDVQRLDVRTLAEYSEGRILLRSISTYLMIRLLPLPILLFRKTGRWRFIVAVESVVRRRLIF